MKNLIAKEKSGSLAAIKEDLDAHLKEAAE